MSDNNINKSASDKITYEQAIDQLEKILADLESSELPLEQSIEKFETGISLVKYCQNILSETEQKVKGLISDKDDIDI